MTQSSATTAAIRLAVELRAWGDCWEDAERVAADVYSLDVTVLRKVLRCDRLNPSGVAASHTELLRDAGLSFFQGKVGQARPGDGDDRLE